MSIDSIVITFFFSYFCLFMPYIFLSWEIFPNFYLRYFFKESTFGIDIPVRYLPFHFINFCSLFPPIWIYSVVSFLNIYFGHFAHGFAPFLIIKHTLKAPCLLWAWQGIKSLFLARAACLVEAGPSECPDCCSARIASQMAPPQGPLGSTGRRGTPSCLPLQPLRGSLPLSGALLQELIQPIPCLLAFLVYGLTPSTSPKIRSQPSPCPHSPGVL